MKEVASDRRPIPISLRQLDNVVATSINAKGAHCIAVDCQTGFYDPRNRIRNHIGVHPQIIEGFVQGRRFQAWLHKFLDNLVQMTKAYQNKSLKHLAKVYITSDAGATQDLQSTQMQLITQVNTYKDHFVSL